MTRLVAAGLAVATALHRHHELGFTSSATAQTSAASFKGRHGMLAHEIVDATGNVEALHSVDFHEDLVEVKDLAAGPERSLTMLESFPASTPTSPSHLEPMASRFTADSIATSGHLDASAAPAMQSMPDLMVVGSAHSGEPVSDTLATSIASSAEPDSVNNERHAGGSMADFNGLNDKSTRTVPVTVAHDSEEVGLFASFLNLSSPSALLADSTTKSPVLNMLSRLESAASQSMADTITMHGQPGASAVHSARSMADLVVGASPQHMPAAGSLSEAIVASAELDDAHQARHSSGSMADLMARHQEDSGRTASVTADHESDRVGLFATFLNLSSPSTLLADLTMKFSDLRMSSRLEPVASQSMADTIAMHGRAGASAVDAIHSMADLVAGASPQHVPVAGSLADAIAASAELDGVHRLRHSRSSIADFMARHEAGSAHTASLPDHTREVWPFSAVLNSVSSKAAATAGLLADALALSLDSHSTTVSYKSMADRMHVAGSDAQVKASMADIMAANMDASEAVSQKSGSLADFISKGSMSSTFKVANTPAFDGSPVKLSSHRLTLALAALEDDAVLANSQPAEPFFMNLPTASEAAPLPSMLLSCLAMLCLFIAIFCFFNDSSKSSGEEVRQTFEIQCPPGSKARDEYESTEFVMAQQQTFKSLDEDQDSFISWQQLDAHLALLNHRSDHVRSPLSTAELLYAVGAEPGRMIGVEEFRLVVSIREWSTTTQAQAEAPAQRLLQESSKVDASARATAAVKPPLAEARPVAPATNSGKPRTDMQGADGGDSAVSDDS